MSEILAAPGSTAQSLQAASSDWEYRGPQREIDSVVDQYVTNPDSLSDDEKVRAIDVARKEAGIDQMQNRAIVQSGGAKYWAAEYPHVFSFNGILRGNFEQVHKDVGQRDNGEAVAISGFGGESTHVIIETDDGHVFTIRRTNDKKSAALQEFEISSTTMHMGVDGDELLRRPVDTQQLKDVVAMPGHPLVLNSDPESGKQLRTRGNVAKITSVNRTEEDRVPDNHPYLSRPEMISDAPERFLGAVEAARQMDAAVAIGPVAVRS